MANHELQRQFLTKLESILPSNQSLATTLSDVLEISMDSAYRRIRLETPLTISEVAILSEKFKLSFDSFLKSDKGQVTFHYNEMTYDLKGFESFFDSMLTDLKALYQHPNCQITYACQDIPIFQNVGFDGISKFKIFYWLRSILCAEPFLNQSFDFDSVPNSLIEKGKEIYKFYSSINSREIWTDTTVQSTLKQIAFYWESGAFKDSQTAIDVCNSLKNQIENVQRQAESGTKTTSATDNYQMYISEIEINNNLAIVNLEKHHSVYLGHLTFNTLSTQNAGYYKMSEHWFDNLVSRSTLITKVGEKHRFVFFKKIYKNIDNLIAKIEEEN